MNAREGREDGFEPDDRLAGKRAVRVDILERLADIIRPLIALDPKTHQGELPAGAAEAGAGLDKD